MFMLLRFYLTLQVHKQSKLVNCECNRSTLDIFMYVSMKYSQSKGSSLQKVPFSEKGIYFFPAVLSAFSFLLLLHELFDMNCL